MKCLTCKQEVEYPDWKCSKAPGNHAIESKEYFHPYGQNVQDVRDRRFNTVSMVLYVTPDYVDGQGQRVKGRNLTVEFSAGRYATADPEQQYFLDAKEKAGLLCNEAQWQAIYMTDDQRLRIREEKLKEREAALVAAESNPLLEKVKAARG